MPDIYTYTDYRKFLGDFYTEKKGQTKGFSFESVSRKAGLSKPFLFMVVKGNRALPKARIFDIAHSLGLSKRETEYFEAMVYFNTARSVNEKEFYFLRMQNLNKKHVATKLKEDQYDYFSNWLNLVIRELVTIMDFKGDFGKLGRAVWPPVTASQAKKSVELLLRLGLIKKARNGRYAQTEKALTTGDEVVSLAVQKFHKDNLAHAALAMDRHPRGQRDISAMTVGVSDQGFHKLKAELQAFRKRLIDIITQDEPASRVYQINFQIYPVSVRSNKEGTP